MTDPLYWRFLGNKRWHYGRLDSLPNGLSHTFQLVTVTLEGAANQTVWVKDDELVSTDEIETRGTDETLNSSTQLALTGTDVTVGS